MSRKASEVDDGPKDIRSIRGLRGEMLPAASYTLLNMKKCTMVFLFPSERDRVFVACFIHSSAQMCLYQTPGRRPPRITGRFGNTAVTTVQISWCSRWFCRSMSAEDSESSRFELTFGGVFIRASLRQHLPNNSFFRLFFKRTFGICFEFFWCS